MEVTLHYEDGSTSAPFVAESFELVNDVAFVDNILHTGVADVSVTA